MINIPEIQYRIQVMIHLIPHHGAALFPLSFFALSVMFYQSIPLTFSPVLEFEGKKQKSYFRATAEAAY